MEDALEIEIHPDIKKYYGFLSKHLNKLFEKNIEVSLFIDPNTNSVESAASGDNNWDILSNGFKQRNTGAEANASGGTYIYMAIGQSLVGSNNVPCTAR